MGLSALAWQLMAQVMEQMMGQHRLLMETR